jgi:uncharacterized protein (DUF983 family)
MTDKPPGATRTPLGAFQPERHAGTDHCCPECGSVFGEFYSAHYCPICKERISARTADENTTLAQYSDDT